MTTPERSVEEIVEEFAERNDCIMCYGKQEKPLERLRQIIETERQKREKVVELVQSIRNDEDVRAYKSNDNYKYYAVGVLDRVLKALTQPNNK